MEAPATSQMGPGVSSYQIELVVDVPNGSSVEKY